MSMHDQSTLEAAVTAAEIQVAGQGVEIVIVLDLEGQIVFTGSGERDRVSAPICTLRGNVVIHNHPGGGSLSRQDVRLMLTHEIVQMRAVATDVVYVLDLPSSIM